MRKWWLQNQDRVVRNLPPRRRGPLLGFSPHAPAGDGLGQRYSYSSYWWRLQTCSAHFSAHQGSLSSNPYPVEVSLSHLCAQTSVPSPQQPVTLKITKGPGETDTLGKADLKDPTHFFFFSSAGKEGPRKPPKEAPKGGCSLEKGLGWSDLDSSAQRSTKCPSYFTTYPQSTQSRAHLPKSPSP